uniref:LamG-like jellyroll fold domain-containing protein n=1 Tax=viral metagenome TaxID=1070528 RepID=A0A6H1ZIY9_9ZZZZ
MKIRFIYGNKGRVLNTNRILLVVLIFLLVLIPFGNPATEPFSITEIRTDYGIAENTIYLEIKDLLGKDQFITNISEIFADHELTDQIEIKEILLKQDYLVNVYGDFNQSYEIKKVNVTETCSEVNETNGTSTCYETVNYFDALGILLNCNYVVNQNKTCLITTQVITGTVTKQDYFNLPSNKEKIKIEGVKIEQKQSGLSIPLPKNGTVYLKIRYSHPFNYGLEVSDEVNKYDIKITTADGSVILDPEWYEGATYTKRLPFNCTYLTDGTPIITNSSTCFEIDGKKQCVWTYCSGTGTAIYKHNSTDFTEYIVANDTHQLPFEVELGNGTSYLPESVWTGDTPYIIQHLQEDPSGTAPQMKDSSSNSNNMTAYNMESGDQKDGNFDGALEFGGTNEYIDKSGLTASYPTTMSFWFKSTDGTMGNVSCKHNPAGWTWGYVEWYGGGWDSTNGFSLNIGYGGDGGGRFAGNIEINVTDGNWHYIVVALGQTTVQFYTDSKSENGVQALGANRNLVGTTLHFVRGYTSTYGTGLYDEFRLYSQTKDSNWVNQTYQNAIGTSGYGNLLAEETYTPPNTAPIITAHVTSPATVYTNTDWLLNITAADTENLTFTAYTQFYINGTSSGSELPFTISNNSNTNIANLSSASFGATYTLIAEMWVSDVEYNSTKTNTTQITVSNSNPIITANATSPSVVYTNTDFKLNLTITDLDADTLTGYVQFYINGSSSGAEQSTSPVTNNTNTLIGTLGNGNFSATYTLIAEFWAGDGTVNTTKENATQVTVYGKMGGTVKDSSNIVVNNAKIIIINQATNTITGTTNSNSTGGWTYDTSVAGTYLVVAYDPNNSTRDGDADPHIVVS